MHPSYTLTHFYFFCRTGLEEQLSYVTEEDYASGLVHKNTPEEIAALHEDIYVKGNVDADDMRVVRAPRPDSEAAADFKPNRRLVHTASTIPLLVHIINGFICSLLIVRCSCWTGCAERRRLFIPCVFNAPNKKR